MYNYFVGLNAFHLSSELNARAAKDPDRIMLVLVNIALSVPSGFLYIYVERVDKENRFSHVIGIAISTALAPPASAIGILFAVLFVQSEYLKRYDIITSLTILSLNVNGIIVGSLIAYVLTKFLTKRKKKESTSTDSSNDLCSTFSSCYIDIVSQC